jgi:hypothetical protein
MGSIREQILALIVATDGGAELPPEAIEKLEAHLAECTPAERRVRADELAGLAIALGRELGEEARPVVEGIAGLIFDLLPALRAHALSEGCHAFERSTKNPFSEATSKKIGDDTIRDRRRTSPLDVRCGRGTSEPEPSK